MSDTPVFPSTLAIPNGPIFTVSHLPAVKSRQIMFACGKFLGPALLGTDGAKTTSSAALALLLYNGDKASFDAMVEALASVTTVRLSAPGIPASQSPPVSLTDVYEAAFGQGRHRQHLQWLKLAVEYNFADFFVASTFGSEPPNVDTAAAP